MTPQELQRLEKLENDMRTHFHTGVDSMQINLRDILGKIEVVSVAPLGKPTNISGQLKIYDDGGSPSVKRFYWYDTKNGLWHYVTATA